MADAALELREIELIRSSWARAAAAPDIAAGLFYARLFRLAPETRPLFRGDMGLQGRKLMQTLGFVVDHLDAPGRLGAETRALGARHVDYGAEPAHYAAVGEALLWTLGETLGPAFDAETRAAWSAAYTSLTDAMLDGARDGGAAAEAPRR